MSERETGSGHIDCDQIVMTPGVIWAAQEEPRDQDTGAHCKETHWLHLVPHLFSLCLNLAEK